MSTRLMSWNIQDLAYWSKIAPTPPDPGRLRFGYIIDSIVERNPAILVVVEVETARPPVFDPRGYLVTFTSGGPAIWHMLQALRLHDASWCVVPPLVSGAGRKKEGVAVFFRANLVNFLGPYQVVNEVINGNVYQYSTRIMPRAPAAWGGSWVGALPPVPPHGGAVALQQDQLAGKAYFDNGGAGLAALYFPDTDSRSPYLASFIEVNPPNRTINVLGVHLPPKSKPAGEAVKRIVQIPEMFGPIAPNEVRVICGDFNLDALRPDRRALLNPLSTTNVTIGAGPATTRYELGNFVAPTMLRRVPDASAAGAMPYLGYMATKWNVAAHDYMPGDQYPDYDHIYVAYGTYPDEPAHGYVMNRVVGTPPIMPEVKQGMGTPIAEILKMPDPPLFGTPSRDEVLRRISNYGKIRGASDHMGVYLDL
jgi:hypothetical protein